MRSKNILLLSLVTVSACFCQEKMRVDLDGPATRTAPQATKGTGMGGDYSRRNVIWRVELSPSAATPAGSTVLEIHIVNLSAVPRTLPMSQDGAKAVAECPEHSVLQGALFVESNADNKYIRQVGRFYGCDAFPATLVQLKPGEWVTYLTKIPTGRLPKEIRVGLNLVHTRYRPGADGPTAEELEPNIFEYSPLVAVPEASATNK